MIMVYQRHMQTDRRKSGRVTYRSISALCSASRGKKIDQFHNVNFRSGIKNRLILFVHVASCVCSMRAGDSGRVRDSGASWLCAGV